MKSCERHAPSGGASRLDLPALHYLLAGETGDSIRGTLQPATRRKRLFDALLALALGSAQHQPLILVYEDLHWIDASTETLLHALVDAVAGVPLMLLCTYRVGYTPPFESRSFLTTLTLQRLSAADTVAMVRHLLGTPDVPVALIGYCSWKRLRGSALCRRGCEDPPRYGRIAAGYRQFSPRSGMRGRRGPRHSPGNYHGPTGPTQCSWQTHCATGVGSWSAVPRAPSGMSRRRARTARGLA